MADSDTNAKSIQENLIKTRIGLDLSERMKEKKVEKGHEDEDTFPIIIEFNINFPGGSTLARLLTLSAFLRTNPNAGGKAAAEIESARRRLLAMHGGDYEEFEEEIAKTFSPVDRIAVSNSLWTENYAFGSLHRRTINDLAGIAFSEKAGRGSKKVVKPLIYKIWLDHDIKANLFESCRTIKSDAARAAFAAAGGRRHRRRQEAPSFSDKKDARAFGRPDAP